MRRWQFSGFVRLGCAVATLLLCAPAFGSTMTCKVGSVSIGPVRTYTLEFDDESNVVVATSRGKVRQFRVVKRVRTDTTHALVLDNVGEGVAATLVLSPQPRLELLIDDRFTQIDPCWAS